MPTLPSPFHLTNHNKGAVINILIASISVGLIILNVNYFHAAIAKNEQIINQLADTSQSEFSLTALWCNEDHAGVKDANPAAVNQEIPELSIALSGIVLTSDDETSFVPINERNEQKRYSPSEAPGSAPGTFTGKINKTSVAFEIHGHYEKVTFHPGLFDAIKQPDLENQNVLADYITATPIHDGEQIYGLRLNPRKGLNVFTTSLPQPGDIILRINNLSLTHPDKVSQALSLLLTQQSVQFVIRRNGVSRLISISIAELTGMNGQRDGGTQQNHLLLADSTTHTLCRTR